MSRDACAECGWVRAHDDDATETFSTFQVPGKTRGDASTAEGEPASLPPGTAVLATVGQIADPPRVSASERTLLVELDGSTSLDVIAARLDMSSRYAQLLAATLLERGLVEMHGLPEPPKRRSPSARRR